MLIAVSIRRTTLTLHKLQAFNYLHNDHCLQNHLFIDASGLKNRQQSELCRKKQAEAQAVYGSTSGHPIILCDTLGILINPD